MFTLHERRVTCVAVLKVHAGGSPRAAEAVVSMHVSLIMCRQANRILKYNLSVLQVPNDSPAQHHGPTLNCRGGQLSSDW